MKHQQQPAPATLVAGHQLQALQQQLHAMPCRVRRLERRLSRAPPLRVPTDLPMKYDKIEDDDEVIQYSELTKQPKANEAVVNPIMAKQPQENAGAVNPIEPTKQKEHEGEMNPIVPTQPKEQVDVVDPVMPKQLQDLYGLFSVGWFSCISPLLPGILHLGGIL